MRKSLLRFFSSEFRSKTAITEKLWKARLQEMEKRNPSNQAQLPPEHLVTKHPRESKQIVNVETSSIQQLDGLLFRLVTEETIHKSIFPSGFWINSRRYGCNGWKCSIHVITSFSLESF